MALYYRVSPNFWKGRRSWSDREKLLAQYLLSCPHRNLEGLYWLPLPYVEADLGWSPRVVRGCLATLEHATFALHDDGAEVVFLVKALAYQAPSTTNQVTGAISSLERVPRTRLWPRFLEACREWAPLLHRELEAKPESHRNLTDMGSSSDADRVPVGPPSDPNTCTRARTLSSNSNSSSNSNWANAPVDLAIDDAKDRLQGETVQRVFDMWLESTGRTGRTVLTPKRRKVIVAALKLYPEDEVTDAVRGWKHDPHNRGETNGTVYNDIELLLRDSAHIEKFRDLERASTVDDTGAFAAKINAKNGVR